MDTEINSWMEQKTWELVELQPYRNFGYIQSCLLIEMSFFMLSDRFIVENSLPMTNHVLSLSTFRYLTIEPLF
jgi:hypothetical protein